MALLVLVELPAGPQPLERELPQRREHFHAHFVRIVDASQDAFVHQRAKLLQERHLVIDLHHAGDERERRTAAEDTIGSGSNTNHGDLP